MNKPKVFHPRLHTRKSGQEEAREKQREQAPVQEERAFQRQLREAREAREARERWQEVEQREREKKAEEANAPRSRTTYHERRRNKRSTPPEENLEHLTTRQRIRKRRRLNKVKLFLMLGSILLLVASYVLLHQPWLAFGRLDVQGNSRVTREEINQWGNVPTPLNIFNVDKKSLAKALQNDYRVESSSVSYGWPNVLRVVIKERQPALYVACEGGEYAKLDRTGHVIDLQPGIPDDSAPYVSGCYVGQVQKGDVIKNQDVLGLLDFLSKLKPDLKKRITEIAMDDQKSIKIFLEGGVPIIIGTYQNGEEKMDTFIAICQELESKKIKAKYIDLTYDKPYVKLQ